MTRDKDIIKGSVYHYKYIDHGAQYRVYAISTVDGQSTGRVVKVPLTFDESRRVLAPHLTQIGLDDTEIDRRIHQLMIRKQQVPMLLQGMFARDVRLMQVFGDLRMIPLLTPPPQHSPEYMLPLYFTQEYVTPMSQFMQPFRFTQHKERTVSMTDVKRARRLFRLIVDLHYHLWEYGVFDLTFKLENIGAVTDKAAVKRVVLVDGAEHTTDLDVAQQTLGETKWRNCLDPTKTDHLFLPPILHAEYSRIMQRGLTQSALTARWQKRSRLIERRVVAQLYVRQKLSRGQKSELGIWMRRQTIHDDLRRGIPKNRVDTMQIPYADLQLLLGDTRAGAMPLSAVARLENAERAYFDRSSDQMPSEIFRHMAQISRY